MRIPYWQIIAVPILLIVGGVLSNQVVLIANGDKFPVLVNDKKYERMLERQAEEDDAEQAVRHFVTLDGLVKIPLSTISIRDAVRADEDGMIDYTHSRMGHNSHLRALADIWDLGNIYSVGDGGIIFGSWLWNFAPLAWLVLVIRKLIAEAQNEPQSRIVR